MLIKSVLSIALLCPAVSYAGGAPADELERSVALLSQVISPERETHLAPVVLGAGVITAGAYGYTYLRSYLKWNDLKFVRGDLLKGAGVVGVTMLLAYALRNVEAERNANLRAESVARSFRELGRVLELPLEEQVRLAHENPRLAELLTSLASFVEAGGPLAFEAPARR